jgi:hypothetical protein
MCIDLTFGVDQRRSDHVLDHAPAGFRVSPSENEDLRRQLSPLAAFHVRSPDACECAMFAQLTGTTTSTEVEHDAEFTAHRRRRGWSEVKIAKALANRRAARTHRPMSEAAQWADAFRAWVPLLVADVGAVVLVAHMFTGALEAESIALSGSLTVRADALATTPAEIPEDTPVRIVPTW